MTYIEDVVNQNAAIVTNGVWLDIGARAFRVHFLGPARLGKSSLIGPEVTVGKFFGVADHAQIMNATIGAFCTFASRVSVVPYQHPLDWLSIHEFQYDVDPYKWLREYVEMERLSHADIPCPGMTQIGNDVWIGHNVVVMPGVSIGDGAVIGANAVVTRDVAPYGIAVGMPATVMRYRFPPEIICRLLDVRWWDMDLRDLSGLPYRDIGKCLDALEAIRAQK